jgi:hypothetical protein
MFVSFQLYIAASDDNLLPHLLQYTELPTFSVPQFVQIITLLLGEILLVVSTLSIENGGAHWKPFLYE